MGRSVIHLSWIILIVAAVGISTPGSSQSVAPDCNIATTPSTVSIDVSPGSSSIGSTTVTVENPTQYTETISIGVEASGLSYAAPGTLTIGAFSSSDFSLTIQAQQRAPHASLPGRVTCTVDEVNGVPNPQPAEKEAAFIIEIEQFGLVRISSDQPFVELESGGSVTLEFEAYNDGNDQDTLEIAVKNRADLELDGVALGSDRDVVVQSSSSTTFVLEVDFPATGGEYEIIVEVVSAFASDEPDPQSADVAVRAMVAEPPSDDPEERSVTDGGSLPFPSLGILIAVILITATLIRRRQLG